MSNETVPDDGKLSKNPEFSMKDVRQIIPKHLFERSYLKSFYWLIHDIILVAIMFYLGTYITEKYIPFITLRAALWLVYWYVQGAFMTGIWVVAHECGHNGFTPNKLLNNVVGLYFIQCCWYHTFHGNILTQSIMQKQIIWNWILFMYHE
eukprot:504996_1